MFRCSRRVSVASFQLWHCWISPLARAALSTTCTHISIFPFCHFINHLIILFVCPFILHRRLPRSPILHCYLIYLTFFQMDFFQFLTRVLGRISPNTPSPSLLFFTCLPPVSFLSVFLRFSITLSPLLIPLADPQREPREWVGLKRERRAVLYPARSSLARLKRSAEKKKQHTGEESFSLSLLFSFLHLSTLLFHHSWVVWYLTFTLLQQGLGSKSSERKLVSPLSYSVIPLFLFPLPLSFLLSLLLFLPLSSNRRSL